MNTKTKIGIIGAGGMLRYHAAGFRSAGAEIVALCDVNDTEPSTWLAINDAAALARRRRGVEPIRIAVN